ncbi:glycine cleavage system protein GcvH [Cesiribacter sp. SM1]|uniref:glycine cleavage system protein GcvH n=1 Tax=Cesiribacter sp. SM1 TaxID=2861196 RepID=UPI001CD25438|nr:glycine cleavage system protein GcvH [Cesiribacter sp. SM1]
MQFPEEFRYTKDHEWISLDGDIATVGITDFAQRELGDIVYVEIETQGETVDQGEVFGTVEAVKTVSDLFMPATGVIEEVNEALQSEPELVNSDPYGKGWMIRIRLENTDDYNNLLSASEYAEMVGQ